MAYEFIGYKDIKSAMNRSILETRQRLSASPMISRQRIVGKRLRENLNRKPMLFLTMVFTMVSTFNIGASCDFFSYTLVLEHPMDRMYEIP